MRNYEKDLFHVVKMHSLTYKRRLKLSKYTPLKTLRSMGNDYSIYKKILSHAKLVSLLLIISINMAGAATSYGQSTLLSLEIRNESIQNVLEEIENQSEYSFFYDNKQINTKRKVTIKSEGKDIFSILDELFSDTKVTYKVLDKNIVLSVKNTNQETVVPERLR